ncbi:riboflavin kinase [Lyophyllum atratum]|nr:riboflavin kinase [Lyophyllum atratum]
MAQTAAEVAAQSDQPPDAPLQTKFRIVRPEVVGPERPEPPFPILLLLAIANLPDESITPISTVAKTGVYYGYAQIIPSKDAEVHLRPEDTKVFPMVMSLGWNPFYKNEQLTAISMAWKCEQVVLGYIRPELDYTSREALIDDINTDKRVALNSLNRPEYQKFARDAHFEVGEQ